jgi:hypothetical protein
MIRMSGWQPPTPGLLVEYNGNARQPGSNCGYTAWQHVGCIIQGAHMKFTSFSTPIRRSD